MSEGEGSHRVTFVRGGGIFVDETTSDRWKVSKKAPHPTRQTLIGAAQECLDRLPWDQVTVDLVLERCGVSRSSLYHHFEDFQDLLEQATAEAISEGTRQAIAMFGTFIESSDSAEDFRRQVFEFGRTIQARERAPYRMRRLSALAATDRNERYRLTVARDQRLLDQAYQELIEAAQAKGWIAPDVDARAMSLFVQAYTLGRVLDDISNEPIEDGRWNDLVEVLLDRYLFRHLG